MKSKKIEQLEEQIDTLTEQTEYWKNRQKFAEDKPELPYAVRPLEEMIDMSSAWTVPPVFFDDKMSSKQTEYWKNRQKFAQERLGYRLPAVDDDPSKDIHLRWNDFDITKKDTHYTLTPKEKTMINYYKDFPPAKTTLWLDNAEWDSLWAHAYLGYKLLADAVGSLSNWLPEDCDILSLFSTLSREIWYREHCLADFENVAYMKDLTKRIQNMLSDSEVSLETPYDDIGRCLETIETILNRFYETKTTT